MISGNGICRGQRGSAGLVGPLEVDRRRYLQEVNNLNAQNSTHRACSGELIILCGPPLCHPLAQIGLGEAPGRFLGETSRTRYN